MSVQFDKINEKISEFLAFSAMLNMRAMRDISKETVELIRTFLADGYTLESYLKEVEAADGKPWSEDDELCKHVRKLFATAATQPISTGTVNAARELNLWEHTKTGNIYEVLPIDARFKTPDGWVDGIAYRRYPHLDNEVFFRRSQDFEAKFTRVKTKEI